LLVHDHVHPVSPELSAVQAFDGGSRCLAVQLYESIATGTPGSVAGDADGADLPVDVEDLAQVTVGDLWGKVADKQSGQWAFP